MELFIKISFWIAIVGAVLRGVCLSGSNYPRSVSYKRWEDVLHIFGGLAWAFWAWRLVWNH